MDRRTDRGDYNIPLFFKKKSMGIIMVITICQIQYYDRVSAD